MNFGFNILKVSQQDIANGIGLRTVIWTTGCTHHCKECHNPQTWERNQGIAFDDTLLEKVISVSSYPYIQGVTFSGGDPLHPLNRSGISKVAKVLKEKMPHKSIWCYTGFLWEEVKDLELMQYIDVLVDGEFQIDKRDVSLTFRGSSNQRIIDVQKSLQSNSVVLLDV